MSYKATDTLAHMITETADEDDIEYALAARIAYEIYRPGAQLHAGGGPPAEGDARRRSGPSVTGGRAR